MLVFCSTQACTVCSLVFPYVIIVCGMMGTECMKYLCIWEDVRRLASQLHSIQKPLLGVCSEMCQPTTYRQQNVSSTETFWPSSAPVLLTCLGPLTLPLFAARFLQIPPAADCAHHQSLLYCGPLSQLPLRTGPVLDRHLQMRRGSSGRRRQFCCCKVDVGGQNRT